jgi:hypothetical protein
MWKRSTTAIDHLSPALEMVVLQTGAKSYGCHLLENAPRDDKIYLPLREDMPRLEQPYHDKLFYHPQWDWIIEYSKNKKWSWIDTRPEYVMVLNQDDIANAATASSSGFIRHRTITRLPKSSAYSFRFTPPLRARVQRFHSLVLQRAGNARATTPART